MIRASIQSSIRESIRSSFGGEVEPTQPSESPRDILIASLFSNDEQGVFPDISDLSTLYQESNQTSPIGPGDDGAPVGFVGDLSGNDNHFIQAVGANRPLYRTNGTHHWIEGDGVSRFIVAPAVPFGSSFDISWSGAVRRTRSNAEERFMWIRAGSNSFQASAAIIVPAAPQWGLYANRGFTQCFRLQTTTAPDTAVFTGRSSNSLPGSFQGRYNGSVITDVVNGTGTISAGVGTQDISLFANPGIGSQYASGSNYGTVVLNRTYTEDEMVAVETWLASKSGVALS